MIYLQPPRFFLSYISLAFSPSGYPVTVIWKMQLFVTWEIKLSSEIQYWFSHMHQHTFAAPESTCKQTVKSQLQLHIRSSKPCLMLDDRLRREVKVLMGLGNCSILLTPLISQRCVYSWGMHEKSIILKTAVGFEHRGLNVIAPYQHMYNCRHIICKHVVQFIQ